MLDLNKLTIHQIAELDLFEVLTCIRNGEWNISEISSWQNAVLTVSYANGYADGRAVVKKPAGELSDWIPDPENPHCSMRIVKGGDPLNVRDRVAFIEKSPRVRVHKFTSTLRDYDKWEYGPSGSSPEYGSYQPSRDWCDAKLRDMGYTF